MEGIKEFLGSGYGNGKGSGYGNGYGNGKGNGYGNGNGCGYGYGNGCGFGYGYGNGRGCGCGNGYGNGDGIKSINGIAVCKIDGIPTAITKVRGNIAKGYILIDNVYLEPCWVVKGNGYFAHGETLREAQDALRDKLMEDIDVDEAIEKFWEMFKRGVKYPAKEFYHWHHYLTGSCEMGRKVFAQEHGIDIERDELTVEEFIKLTRNAYGGDVIRRLEGGK